MLRNSLRQPKPASRTLDHQMKLYSAAALAAGVGMMALAQPAEGEVVVTKKTIPIPVSQYGGIQYLVPVSLNNNGINDFSFSLYSFAYHSAFRELRIFPLEGGAVVAKVETKGETPLALQLGRGAKIGPSAVFSSDNNTEIEGSHANFGYRSGKSYYSKTFAGNWGNNAKNSYLGVKFLISGKTHYGWIRLTVTTSSRGAMSATITGYAYETVANKVINAGTTSGAASSAETKAEVRSETRGHAGLGMLALGAEGLPMWRREGTTYAH